MTLFNKRDRSIVQTVFLLTILKEFVELLDGTVRVESEEGKGTTFIVELPLELDLYQENPEEKETEETMELKGVRVLLAEDHPLRQEITQYFLKQLQVECMTVKNGKEAVGTVEKDERGFSMILMDLQMPEIHLAKPLTKEGLTQMVKRYVGSSEQYIADKLQ